VYRKVPAADLWKQIIASTYDHAEPGVLFIDLMNRDNKPILHRGNRSHQSVR